MEHVPEGQSLTITDVVQTADLQPEVSAGSNPSGPRSWTTLDLLVTLDVVKLHLYDEFASSEQSLKEHGITRMALNSCRLKAKMLSDSASEAEVVLKSFTMSNTRPGNTKFREIIPGAQHNRNQVMILYTSSGGADSSAIAIVTVDSPQIIFAVEPIIGLLEFFTSAFKSQPQDEDEDSEAVTSPGSQPAASSGSFDFRFDLHDVSVSILEDDTSSDTQAIRLTVKQLLVSQQVRS